MPIRPVDNLAPGESSNGHWPLDFDPYSLRNAQSQCP